MTEPSPLLSVSDDALAAIFAADPLTLTDTDLTILITELRRRRSAFLAESAAKSLAPKSPRPKADPGVQVPAALAKPASEISLEDL